MCNCERCDYTTNRPFNLLRHTKTVHKAAKTEIVHQLDLNDVNVVVQSLRAEIEILKKKIDLQENPQSNTQNINSHNTNNGTIININGIGKENTSYLSQKFMTKCIKNKLNGIMEYLKYKHFHIEHPENHNLKKLTKKDLFMECHDGKKWNIKYCDDLLHDVFNNMQSAFGDFVESTMKDGKLKKVWLDNFMADVGSPLEWDITCEDYEFTDKLTDDQRNRLKDRVFSLAIEHIYQHSKKLV